MLKLILTVKRKPASSSKKTLKSSVLPLLSIVFVLVTLSLTVYNIKFQQNIPRILGAYSLPLHENIVTGKSTNLTYVATGNSVTTAPSKLYLASISSKPYRAVTKVEGLGLSWTKVVTHCSGRNQTGVEIWMAKGSPSQNGTVKATFVTSTKNSVIAVSRISGAELVSPIGNIRTLNTIGVDGICSGGIDGNSYSTSLLTRGGSLIYSSAAIRLKTHSPGPGFTEYTEVSAGNSGDMAGLAVMGKTSNSADSVMISGTLSGSTDWAVASIEILGMAISTTSPTPTLLTTPTPLHTPTPNPPPTGTIYRAFTDNSYWNTPMPASAPIDPLSGTYITDAKNPSVSTAFLRFAGAPDHAAGYDWSYPIYWANTTDPWYHIIGSPTVDARIPRGATPMGGSDGGIIIYDLAANQVFEMYQAHYDSVTDKWSSGSNKRYVLSSNGLEWGVAGSNNSLNKGHRGIPSPMRAIRRDEALSGNIQHRLECFWHATGEKKYWPMSGYESGKGGITPEGIVLRLKRSVIITNRGFSRTELAIAKAMQEYGCVIGDNEGGINNTLKLERGPLDWKAVDPNLNMNAFSTFTWDDYEFIQGGYDPVSRTIRN